MYGETKKVLDEIGTALILFKNSALHLPSLPAQFHRFIDQCFVIGYKTMPIVALLSFFIGAVLALQAGFAMSSVKEFMRHLGTLVGLSMCRELGPVMTAFLLAGRVGSAITAEIASMKVYHEVDALHTMNIPPERILVMPRLAAVIVMMPVLTLLSIVIGWHGGMVIAYLVGFISLDPLIYWQSLKEFVLLSDVIDGLIKAEIFGILVVLIACNTGLQTRGGPREIGSAVTRSVVTSMVMILLLDFFVTRLTM